MENEPQLVSEEDNIEDHDLLRRIMTKKLTICETCDNIFTYIPQKILCDECKRENRAQKRAYREANAEKISAQVKAYYKANSEKIKTYQRAYRKANAEKISAQQKAYYKANAEKIRAYREANRDEINAKQKAAYHAKKASN